jgi:hypothetical protein
MSFLDRVLVVVVVVVVVAVVVVVVLLVLDNSSIVAPHRQLTLASFYRLHRDTIVAVQIYCGVVDARDFCNLDSAEESPTWVSYVKDSKKRVKYVVKMIDSFCVRYLYIMHTIPLS